jgi:hypothetical protein
MKKGPQELVIDHGDKKHAMPAKWGIIWGCRVF